MHANTLIVWQKGLCREKEENIKRYKKLKAILVGTQTHNGWCHTQKQTEANIGRVASSTNPIEQTNNMLKKKN